MDWEIGVRQKRRCSQLRSNPTASVKGIPQRIYKVPLLFCKKHGDGGDEVRAPIVSVEQTENLFSGVRTAANHLLYDSDCLLRPTSQV
jgi:hypothetical protein